VTAAKKAAARPPKRAAPARSASSGAKAASHPAKKSAPKKLAPSAKKAVSASNKTAPKRAVSTGKKVAPASKRAVPGGKQATRASKGAAAAGKKPSATGKKAVPGGRKAGASSGTASPKKAAPEAKKVTGAATKTAPVTAKAPAAKKVAPAPKRPTVGPYAKEPKFLEEQGALLAEERSIYKGQAVDLRAEADSLALEREPGDVQFDEESGEGGTVTVDRERNLALSAQAAAAVEEIDDALRKIERKAYGSCERCYQPIPKARLRALPFARLCVACKSGGLSRR
jgi:DnaK suppressor protein